MVEILQKFVAFSEYMNFKFNETCFYLSFLEFGKASTPLKETIDSDSVFDDFEHLGVNDETTDSNKNSGFTVITNKNPDEVIKSFFENPKQFSNQNDAPQQSSSTTVVKKFTKMSQKERKKQLLKEETSPPPVKDDKPKWTGWGDTTSCQPQTNGKVSLASIMKSEESAHDIRGMK